MDRSDVEAGWNGFRANKRQARTLFISAFALFLILLGFFYFLSWNEQRRGFLFNDPLLGYWRAADVSGITFTLTYFFSVAAIGLAMCRPSRIIRLIQGYAILTLIRMAALYVLPLEAPEGIIPLKDELLHASFYSGRENLKDLFFSGHTATMFLFAFLSEKKEWKLTFFFAGMAVGVLLLLQHVHYSIDVLAAPLAAFFAYRLSNVSRNIAAE